MAGSKEASRITVHHLRTLPELNAAVRLQKEIWGFEDIELLPLRLFVVSTKVGGQAIGAFDGKHMIGFLLAIPGIKPGGVQYLHSHMMGVAAGYRNRGVGRMLKLEQRDEALARGIRLVEWTFDPLEIKNAYFNIERLGATVRRYVLNQYGTTTSHLHGGLPTDRCVAEWHLDSARVSDALEGKMKRGRVLERIAVPADIAEIRTNEPKRALQIQKRISERFVEYTGQGLAVVGFEKAAHAGTYLFGQWATK